MYDKHTDTLWHALTGEPVIGELAHSGLQLKILPVTTTTWEEWLAAHPDTKVLSRDTGHRRPYLHHSESGAAYSEYFADPGLMFPVFALDGRLRPKDEVLALRFNGEAKAFMLDALKGVPVHNDTVGGQEVVIVTDRLSRAARPYERGKRAFTAGPTPQTLLDESGTPWSIEELRLVNAVTGEALERLGSHTAYWFGWRSFYPETELWKGEVTGNR